MHVCQIECLYDSERKKERKREKEKELKGEAVTRISGYSYKRLLVYYKGGQLLV